MNKYNYLEAITNDIECWLENNSFDISQFENREEAAEYLNDVLFAEDYITGNGGMFYGGESKCEEYLCHNLDLAFQACEEFDVEWKTLRHEFSSGTLARYLDCTIRCYVLMTAIYNALEEWEGYSNKYYES